MGVGLFQVTSEGTRRNGLRLRQERFRWITGKVFSGRVAKCCNRLAGEVDESPPLKVLKHM